MNKIFGIGLPKTGQTSLASAMRDLGFRTIQYPKRSSYIETNDFILDLPVTCSYKKLDKKYPKSKFIMSIRDYDSWIKSMRNHYRTHPASRRSKLTLKFRQKFWGTTHFDQEKMTKKYYEHLDDVKNYFVGRKKDLLIINVVAGEGWKELCHFLGKEIPNKPFPKKNVGKYN